MIDLHVHALPGIDDGPATLEDTLALCEAARASGTQTIVATSHLNFAYPDNDAVVIHRGVAELNRRLRDMAIDVLVRPGAEMALGRLTDLSDAEIGVLRLGGGPYVLVECPHQSDTEVGIRDALRAFAKRGHGVVLAHPERSPTFQKHPRLLTDLVADGMLSCITARALTGDYGITARAYAWEMLETGLVHAIASDAHDVVRRPPDLRPTLERAGLEPGPIEHFIGEAPAAIIAGETIPVAPRVSGPAQRKALGDRLARRWKPSEQ